jgi:hypothetical protein
MISDVLSDACRNIQSYLGDPTYISMYSGELRAEIKHVVAAMNSLREKLDQPPATKRDATHQ